MLRLLIIPKFVQKQNHFSDIYLGITRIYISKILFYLLVLYEYGLTSTAKKLVKEISLQIFLCQFDDNKEIYDSFSNDILLVTI